jgi:hypothetical protein
MTANEDSRQYERYNGKQPGRHAAQINKNIKAHYSGTQPGRHAAQINEIIKAQPYHYPARLVYAVFNRLSAP